MIATLGVLAAFGVCMMLGEQPWRQLPPRDWDAQAYGIWLKRREG